MAATDQDQAPAPETNVVRLFGTASVAVQLADRQRRMEIQAARREIAEADARAATRAIT